MTDLLAHVESIWQAVVPQLPDFTVEVVPSIDSTNSELMRRARQGRHEPVLLVAEDQTAGRGRVGKGWHSRPGQSLTFSLALPLSPADWSGLSLAVGVSLAEHLHPQVRLKWPNDLWWQERKLGGILVETASVGERRYAVIGAGLNVATPELPPAPAVPDDMSALPPVPPVGLRELGGVAAALDAGEWLAAVVPGLVRDLLDFEREGFAPFAERFAARDALAGRSLRLSDGREGEAAGVGPDGALLLRTAHGVEAVTSAEVSVRPC